MLVFRKVEAICNTYVRYRCIAKCEKFNRQIINRNIDRQTYTMKNYTKTLKIQKLNTEWQNN